MTKVRIDVYVFMVSSFHFITEPWLLQADVVSSGVVRDNSLILMTPFRSIQLFMKEGFYFDFIKALHLH